MKTKDIHRNIKFIEWFSAEDMHSNSKEWLSELNFIKDEQLFFKDLIASYTLQLIDKEHFSENKKVITALDASNKENETLIGVLNTHENNLKVMVDGIDQPEQETIYKSEHKDLALIMHTFLKNYKLLKVALFAIIKTIKKAEKQKRLLE